MKKLASLLLIFAIILPVIANAAGTAEIGIGYQMCFDSDRIESHGVGIAVQGSDLFGESRIIGIEYTLEKPFMFQALREASIYTFGTKALANWQLNSMVGIQAKAGLFDMIITQNKMMATQIGFSLGLNLRMNICRDFGLALDTEYKTPVFTIYDKTIKNTAFKTNYIQYSLMFSYLY